MTFFIVCATVGGVLLVAGLVLAAMGVDGDADVHTELHTDAHTAGTDGLNLFSVRALSAGLAFFGLAGLGAQQAGAHLLIAVTAAAIVGVVAMLLVAMAMRAMLRLEHDASVRIDRAIGQAGTVYVPVPAAGEGLGKVLVILQGRTVELQAVTTEGQPLPTGAAVVVVDVRDRDTVEVVLLPPIDGVL